MNGTTPGPEPRGEHPFRRRAAAGPGEPPVARMRRPPPGPRPPGSNRRWAWLSLTLGVALMTGVQLAEARTVTGGGDFAAPAAGPIAPTSPSLSPASPAARLIAPTTPASTTPASTTPASTAAGPSVEPPPADPATADTPPVPVAAGVPLELRLPRLDVQADIDPVGQVDGELEVPEDIRRLGWWTGSTAAGGSAGTTVIDGHIDSPQGRGVFFHLQEVEPDDEVVLTVAGGATVTYRVTERRSYHKADGLPAEVFASTATPRLVLITCGGRYDHTAASYDDNIVVIAVPA